MLAIIASYSQESMVMSMEGLLRKIFHTLMKTLTMIMVLSSTLRQMRPKMQKSCNFSATKVVISDGSLSILHV